MSDNVFGEMPVTGPLNDRLATLGYDSMAPIAETETVSVILTMTLIGFIIMLSSLCCYCKCGSMLAGRWVANVGGFIFWGAIINLVLVYYLPVLTAAFISNVGMYWEAGGKAATYTNVWTMLLLNIWVVFPLGILGMLQVHR